MNRDKKLRLLLVPLIFMVLIHIPMMIYDIAPNAYIQEMSEVLWTIFWLIICISVLIWCVTFYHILIGVYIAILVVYTVVSWIWIWKQKKGNVMYFIVWFILGALSILLYWRLGPQYYSMINM